MIELIKAFPYDNNYDYIKMFNTKQEQDNYFNTLDSIVIEKNNYIKIENSFNVEYDYDFLVNEGVNYIVFNNGYKDIYAFIINKEYVRENLTKLIYEVDVIQTYMFDFSLNRSFVERKKCSIDEIVDFDEGLNLGEHIIENVELVFEKESQYFAMFNGFKEQQLIFEGGILKSVVDLPFNTSKPLTTIDGIQYPLYFMPLKEQNEYAAATYSEIGLGGSSMNGYIVSKKIFRFLKGYEGFGSYPYLDSGGVPTYGYGITENSGFWDSLGDAPCSEILASKVLAETIYNNYARKLYDKMENDGVDMLSIKRHHFDAFLSLCYNGGIGAVTDSSMYAKFLENPNNPTIATDWLTYYIRDNNGVEQQGLKDRRKAEAQIYNNSIYEYRTIVTLDDNGTINGFITNNNGNGYIPNELYGDL